MHVPLTKQRLKVSEIPIIRQRLSSSQGERCAICQLPIGPRPVLDHDHSSGLVRGVLHSGCNAVLGKVENSYKRYGVPSLHPFLNGLSAYLYKHATDQTGLFHPTHKTDDEKRVRRNTLARKARASKKE